MSRRPSAKGAARDEELGPEAVETKRLTDQAFDLGVRKRCEGKEMIVTVPQQACCGQCALSAVERLPPPCRRLDGHLGCRRCCRARGVSASTRCRPQRVRAILFHERGKKMRATCLLRKSRCGTVGRHGRRASPDLLPDCSTPASARHGPLAAAGMGRCPLTPPVASPPACVLRAAMARANGKDIVKRSSTRKGRYLLVFNFQLAAAAAGKLVGAPAAGCTACRGGCRGATRLAHYGKSCEERGHAGWCACQMQRLHGPARASLRCAAAGAGHAGGAGHAQPGHVPGLPAGPAQAVWWVVEGEWRTGRDGTLRTTQEQVSCAKGAAASLASASPPTRACVCGRVACGTRRRCAAVP